MPGPQPITVPIFPLDGVLLVPGFPMRFHIFEPRYQQMLRWALDHDRRIAIAVPAPGHSMKDEREPPIFPIAGLGVIAGHRPLDDGRADIELRGIGRVRIITELPPAWDFRMVQVEQLTDHLPADPALVTEFATGVARIRRALDLRHPGAAEQLGLLSPAEVIDAALVALPVELNTRLYMFAELDLVKRMRLVVHCLDRIVKPDADPGTRAGTGTGTGPDDPRRN